MNGRYSKLAFLHRVKERKTPSLSAQASFAPFSLKVAWSGKSLILTFLRPVSCSGVCFLSSSWMSLTCCCRAYRVREEREAFSSAFSSLRRACSSRGRSSVPGRARGFFGEPPVKGNTVDSHYWVIPETLY